MTHQIVNLCVLISQVLIVAVAVWRGQAGLAAMSGVGAALAFVIWFDGVLYARDGVCPRKKARP